MCNSLFCSGTEHLNGLISLRVDGHPHRKHSLYLTLLDYVNNVNYVNFINNANTNHVNKSMNVALEGTLMQI